MKCGLLGRKLGHSYSPKIHSMLGNYSYQLFQIEPEELSHFLRTEDYDGLNVTIPYKQAIMPLLDELTPIASELGAVNTVLNRDGKRLGHNTDYAGFLAMIRASGLCPAGKKCLVLGSGGASRVAVAVLKKMGGHVTVISRSGIDNYENLSRHEDAAILVNTTPVGMYPDTMVSPVSLSDFPVLEGVLDVIYNPAKTKLLLDAESRGIIAINGLEMLVAQAKEAAEWFTGHTIDDNKIPLIHAALRSHMENIILIGMPGSGKSTVGKLLAERLGKPFVDADSVIETMTGHTIPEIFARDGEEAFRALETEVLSRLGKESSLVIATGGGCVTRRENQAHLQQNGRIIWLQRSVTHLATNGRPLSQKQSLPHLEAIRRPLYAAFSHDTVENNGTLEDAVNAILEVLK